MELKPADLRWLASCGTRVAVDRERRMEMLTALQRALAVELVAASKAITESKKVEKK